MKKRIVSLVLALTFVFALFPQAALAADYVEAVPCKYSTVLLFYDGVTTVWANGAIGYINEAGKRIAPPGK